MIIDDTYLKAFVEVMIEVHLGLEAVTEIVRGDQLLALHLLQTSLELFHSYQE